MSPIKKLKQFNHYKMVVMLVGAVLIAVISFAIGMEVGVHKAKFSYRWGENYERNFVGPPPPGPMGMFDDMGGHGFRNAHGVAGSIVSIDNNNLVVKDRSGDENNITLSSITIIRKYHGNIGVGDLKSGDEVVVLGRPGDNGVINADIIRVFDNPTNSNNNSQIN